MNFFTVISLTITLKTMSETHYLYNISDYIRNNDVENFTKFIDRAITIGSGIESNYATKISNIYDSIKRAVQEETESFSEITPEGKRTAKGIILSVEMINAIIDFCDRVEYKSDVIFTHTDPNTYIGNSVIQSTVFNYINNKKRTPEEEKEYIENFEATIKRLIDIYIEHREYLKLMRSNIYQKNILHFITSHTGIPFDTRFNLMKYIVLKIDEIPAKELAENHYKMYISMAPEKAKKIILVDFINTIWIDKRNNGKVPMSFIMDDFNITEEQKTKFIREFIPYGMYVGPICGSLPGIVRAIWKKLPENLTKNMEVANRVYDKLYEEDSSLKKKNAKNHRRMNELMKLRGFPEVSVYDNMDKIRPTLLKKYPYELISYIPLEKGIKTRDGKRKVKQIRYSMRCPEDLREEIIAIYESRRARLEMRK